MTHFQYYLNKATSCTQPKSRNIKDKTRACDPREKMDKHITKIIEYWREKLQWSWMTLMSKSIRSKKWYELKTSTSLNSWCDTLELGTCTFSNQTKKMVWQNLKSNHIILYFKPNQIGLENCKLVEFRLLFGTWLRNFFSFKELKYAWDD